MKRVSTLMLLASLTACGDGSPRDSIQETVNTSPVGFSAFNEVVPGTYFATIDPKFGYAAIQNTAKDLCGDEPICKVIIFKSGTVLPTSFPMTDREAEETIGNYTLNRNSGLDELIAKCPDIVGTPDDKCAAAVGP